MYNVYLRAIAIANKPVRLFVKALTAVHCLPLAFLQNRGKIRLLLRCVLRDGFSACFPYFEIVVTTRCSLRCKYCANLIQYYREPYDLEPVVLKSSIAKLMRCCDYVAKVRLIGGEPFLYKDLAEILEFLMRYPQIGSIEIPTNGTVPIRDEQLLSILKQGRGHVYVSDYGYGKAAEFCRVLRENGIP